jgi:hypothetical protein
VAEISSALRAVDEDLLAFELLNEVYFKSSAVWNEIAQRILQAIRRIDSQRLVLLGGNYFCSVDHLSELVQLDDPELLYKFHFYLPASVTHQKAYWFDGLYEFDGRWTIRDKHPACRSFWRRILNIKNVSMRMWGSILTVPIS